MSATVPYTAQEVSSLIEALEQLTDPRDRRGRRHALAFIVASVVMALLHRRSRVSGIYRFIRNRLEW